MGRRTISLRFNLADAEFRRFLPERYCFRGAIDDWIGLGPPAPLPKLVKKMVFPGIGTSTKQA
jgi:hypothetical protein